MASLLTNFSLIIQVQRSHFEWDEGAVILLLVSWPLALLLQ